MDPVGEISGNHRIGKASGAAADARAPIKRAPCRRKAGHPAILGLEAGPALRYGGPAPAAFAARVCQASGSRPFATDGTQRPQCPRLVGAGPRSVGDMPDPQAGLAGVTVQTRYSQRNARTLVMPERAAYQGGVLAPSIPGRTRDMPPARDCRSEGMRA